VTFTSKRIGLIVALIVVALSGLVLLQSSLLEYAMELKEQAFRRNVMAALGQVSSSLATGEVIMMAISTDSTNRVTVETRIESDFTIGPDSLQRTSHDFQVFGCDTVDALPIRAEDGVIHYSVQSPQHVFIQMFDLGGGRDTVIVDTFREPGDYRISGLDEEFTEGSYLWKFATDSVSRVMRVENGTSAAFLPSDTSESGKRRLVARIFDNLIHAELDPIEDRLDSLNVDSIIAGAFRESGIDLEYAYGIISGPGDSLRVVRPPEYRDDIHNSDFRVRLFQQDIFAPTSYLSVYFPDHRAYLWGQIVPLLTATVILMLIIIACFAYTIRTIFRQRRLSGLMVDFINNMTHEFKTPISTVALATEAIQRPDILDQKDKVLHFNEMIQNENRRMHKQTDKILQMAALEEKDYELTLVEVDLHQIITKAVDSVALHVENRGGSIRCHLDAKRHTLYADKVHLANVIYNLLDNANKYSFDKPGITVRTFDSNRGVGVRIEDRGIGLTPEDRKHVFDKYFRVSSGNRHDVKGFGIGLSYVKLIVEAHGGNIEINSKLGEGAEVELILPYGRKDSV